MRGAIPKERPMEELKEVVASLAEPGVLDHRRVPVVHAHGAELREAERK
jgi:hypothetical protein